MSRTREILLSLIVAACLSLCVVFASSYHGDREKNRTEIINMQFALLEGKNYVLNGRSMYLAPFQNRVLFPLALVGVTRLGILDANDAFLILRLASGTLMFLVLWWTARGISGGSPKLAAAGALLLLYCLILTFGFGWEHPTDFLDAIFIALMAYATARKSPLLLLAIALLAATNRESAAFAGVLWAFCYGFNEKWRPNFPELGRALVLAALPYMAVLFLRYYFGGARALSEGTQLLTALNDFLKQVQTVQDYLTPFNWLALGLAMFALPILWLLVNRRSLLRIQRRLVYAALTILVITFFFGIVSELRIFIPSIVILILTAVWGEVQNLERKKLAT